MISMFINFTPNTLDDLLSKSDVTLEEILEAEVLEEIKLNGAQKFALFIIKDVNNYQKMIKYIHQLDLDNPKLKRYQFLISEILSYDISILIDYLFEPEPNIPNYQFQEEQRKQLLPLLFQPFQADYLNITQVGYLSKIIESVIRKRGNSLRKWLDNNQSILDNLIKHLDINHVTSIITHLISNEQTIQEQNSNENQNQIIKLLQRILTLLLNKIHNFELVNNCCQLFIDISNKPQQFVTYFDQPENFYTAACDTGFVQFLNVIEALLSYRQPEENYNYSKYHYIAQNIHSLLSNEHLSYAFISTLNILQTTLGQFKLKILQIYLLFLKTEDFNLLQLIHHQDIYNTLYKFITKFEFNNQLQIQFYQITILIFQTNSLSWIQNLIQEDLLKFICSTNTQTKSIIGHIKNPINRGYFGILSQLSYQLEEYSIDSEHWNSYKQNLLPKIKSIEQNYYFNINPKGIVVEQNQTTAKENFQYFKQYVQQDKLDSIDVEINNSKNNKSDFGLTQQARLKLSFPIKTLLSFSDMNTNYNLNNPIIKDDSKLQQQVLDQDSLDFTELQKKKICSSQNEYTKNNLAQISLELSEGKIVTEVINVNQNDNLQY